MSAVSFIVALPFLLIGLHLLRVAVRSGAVPERLLAAFFLLCACGAVPRIAAVDLVTSGEGLSWTTFWLNMSANLAIGGALVCLAAFAWKVFRPDATWARNLVAAFAAALGAVTLTGATSLEASGGANPVSIAFNAVGTCTLTWTFVECVLYQRTLRKRLALGLADPLVVNRFFLWSLWTGAISLQAMITAVLRLSLWWSGAAELMRDGVDPGGHWLLWIRAAKGVVAIVGPVALVSVFLSFSPPARYRQWLRSEQAELETAPSALR